MFSRNPTKFLAIGAVAIALAGGSYGIVSATASTAATATAASAPSARLAARGGPNARSGPAAGGSSGKVESASTSSLTILTPAGQKVTVKKASTTKYDSGTSSISASAVKKGASVLVLGTTTGTTITASKVVVQLAGGESRSSSTAAEVVPFQRGSQSTSKQAGQIPASYSQGSGTIVSGPPASKATEAALAAYPGGVVDRVVKLSNGGYEVHNIGVNWPHHIFVSQSFKVVGAN